MIFLPEIELKENKTCKFCYGEKTPYREPVLKEPWVHLQFFFLLGVVLFEAKKWLRKVFHRAFSIAYYSHAVHGLFRREEKAYKTVMAVLPLGHGEGGCVNPRATLKTGEKSLAQVIEIV